MQNTIKLTLLFLIPGIHWMVSTSFENHYLYPKQALFQISLFSLGVLFSLGHAVSIRLNAESVSVLCFLGWSILSALLGHGPMASFSRITHWYAFGLFVFLLQTLFQSRRDRQRLFLSFLVAVDGVCVFYVSEWIGCPWFEKVREGMNASSLGNPDFVATSCAAMSVALLSKMWEARGKFRIGWSLNFLLLIVVLVSTQSRGGYFGFMVAALVFWWTRRKMPGKGYAFCFLLSALTILFVPIFIFKSERPYTSLNDRVMIWNATWRTALEKPWTGHGPGAWLSISWKHRTQFIFEENRDLYAENAVYRFYDHAHNDYLETTAELGIPGAILFMGVILLALRKSFLDKGEASHACATLAILVHALFSFPLQTTVGMASLLLHWFLSLPEETECKAGKTAKNPLNMALALFSTLALVYSIAWCGGVMTR